MPDIKDALERLREDVSGAGLASAAEVRRTADRRRLAGWAAVPAAAALVAAAVLVPSALLAGSEGDGKSVSVTPATSAPSPAVSGPSPDQPWLPTPWRVDSAQRISLSAAGTAGDDFCGIAKFEGATSTMRQSLSDGARAVRVYAIATPSFERASSLFKRLYSECAGLGSVSSEEGPAMYWQAAGEAPAGALWGKTTVYLVASGQPGTKGPQLDLRLVVAGLIDTVGQPCTDSMAGTACPPTQS